MRTFRTFDCRPREFQQFLFSNHAQLSRISNGDCLLCDIQKKWIYWVSFMSRLHSEALSECVVEEDSGKHRWVVRVLSDLLYYKTPAELIPNLILDSLIQISGSHIRYWIKFCWCHSSVVMDNSRGERLHSEFHSSAKYLDFQATTVMIRVTLLYRRGS